MARWCCRGEGGGGDCSSHYPWEHAEEKKIRRKGGTRKDEEVNKRGEEDKAKTQREREKRKGAIFLKEGK